MPQFPEAESLGTRLPQDRSVVVRENVDLSGQESFANALQQYASDAKQRKDGLNLQKAKTHWAKRKLEADNAFDQDQDFETYLERYDQLLSKAETEASEMISNDRMKELFREDVSLSRVGGIEQMKDHAFSKEKDFGLADLQQLLTDNRELALNATTDADRQSAFDTMNDALGVSVLNGYLDADTAQAMREQVGVDAAIGTVQVQDLETQQKMLSENSGPVKLIPTDTRKKMLDTVNKNLTNEQALGEADQIRLQGGTLEDRYKSANKITDLEVREKTKRQITTDFQREKNAQTVNEYDAFQVLAKDVIAGSTPQEVQSQNQELWGNLTAEQQGSILSMGQKKVTDLAAYHRINLALAEGQVEGYVQFMRDADKLSSGEFKHFSDLLSKPPEETKPLFTIQQDFARRVGEQQLDLSDKEKGLAETLLVEEFDRFQAVNPGEKPNADEQKEIMDHVFDKVVVEGFWGTKEIPRFELTPANRQKMNFQDDVEKFKQMSSEYTARTGQRLTQDTADLLFEDMVRSGAIQPWNVRGRDLPIKLELPDGSVVDEFGNVTLSRSAFEAKP